MVRHRVVGLVVLLAVVGFAWCGLAAERLEVDFPDLPGYVTLKADLHMHTIYSDGSVLPAIRAKEAWRNGLDVFAITDRAVFPST